MLRWQGTLIQQCLLNWRGATCFSWYPLWLCGKNLSSKGIPVVQPVQQSSPLIRDYQFKMTLLNIISSLLWTWSLRELRKINIMSYSWDRTMQVFLGNELAMQSILRVTSYWERFNTSLIKHWTIAYWNDYAKVESTPLGAFEIEMKLGHATACYQGHNNEIRVRKHTNCQSQ